MIRNKLALIASAVILCLCMAMYFPFPNNPMLNSNSTFMSFPIHNKDGVILFGVIGSILFIVAMILLVIGMKKYHFRTILLVAVIYTFLPSLLVTAYQETLTSGVMAVSYNGSGTCVFEYKDEDEGKDEELLNGECSLTLQNHSNKDVTFELEFLDTIFFEDEDEVRMESLMNLNGPRMITIGANSKQSIHLNESLDLTDVPSHIDSGTSEGIYIKLIDGKTTRSL